MASTTAFTTPLPLHPTRPSTSAALSEHQQQSRYTRPRRAMPRMEAAEAKTTEAPPNVTSDSSADVSEVAPAMPPTWPPPEMSDEWAQAIERLVKQVPAVTVTEADVALDEADGDEMAALRMLMDDNWTDIRRQREAVVTAARASGDVNRVSALKEAELRRKATGSANDFFKSFVDIEGSYIDSGYVDDSADAMGGFMNAVKGLFGKKKE